MDLPASSILPHGSNCHLAHPNAIDAAAFIEAVQNSQSLLSHWVSPPSTVADYEAYCHKVDNDRNYGFIVVHNDTQELVGVININEIVKGVFESGYLGYYAFTPLAGQGLMSQGLSLVLSFYFSTLQLHRLEANIQPSNHASIQFIKRHGFIQEGFSPRYLKINGQWEDHERYALTKETYIERAKATAL